MFLITASLFSIKQLALPVILGATCLVGDIILDIVKYELLRSLCDNLTHALIGALSALILVLKLHDRLSSDEQKLLVIFGFTAAALVDVDHFIEARSFRLKVNSTSFLKEISNLICILIGCYESEPSTVPTLQQHSVHNIACVFGHCTFAIISTECLVGCTFYGYYDTSYTRCNEERILDSALRTHATYSVHFIYWTYCNNSVCNGRLDERFPA